MGGGRPLDQITVVGGAVTPKPMNAGAVIVSGKSGAWAPVVDVYADVQARRRDPDRERRRAEDELLAAASWPPPSIDRESRLALLRGAAQAKAARLADDGDRLERERWERANAYSTGLAEWMAEHR